MMAQKKPHTIYYLVHLGGIDGVKLNTWWQLTADDDCLRLVSTMLFDKTEILIPYDHLAILRRWHDQHFMGTRGGRTRALVGGALGGDAGALAGALSAPKRMSDQLGLCIYRDGVEVFNELLEKDALDPRKEVQAFFRWDYWRPNAFGDKSFFKTVVERCPMLEYSGIEEWLDFRPL
ncbi:hypothetical protein [Collinsella bouchesdurhonensis]|uniref:hypothetical protein n=1 Tax=Collinsella bouchesdurhonensis TaxID=1907654 RepID=UPI00058C3056|nr:hypothetical protein [Collinsella bouchesdurhonensis]